jgi:hypothetical protein
MASVLSQEPVWFTSRRSKYSWDQWLDGQTWHLKKGEDFTVASGALRAAAANAAKVRDLDLRAKITPEGDVILRALHKKDDADSAE